MPHLAIVDCGITTYHTSKVKHNLSSLRTEFYVTFQIDLVHFREIHVIIEHVIIVLVLG